MNGKWLTLGLAGIVALLLAWMRKYVGIAVLMLVALFCVAYFKADYLQMRREEAQRVEAREMRILNDEKEKRRESAVERERIRQMDVERKAAVDLQLKRETEADERVRKRVAAIQAQEAATHEAAARIARELEEVEEGLRQRQVAAAQEEKERKAKFVHAVTDILRINPSTVKVTMRQNITGPGGEWNVERKVNVNCSARTSATVELNWIVGDRVPGMEMFFNKYAPWTSKEEDLYARICNM